MANILQRLYAVLDRSNKIRTISSSGSVPGNKMEKIRSGQSYLYQISGMESEVVEIRFCDKISGSFLNQALLKAMERYPYLNTRLVELDGDFYIVQNPNSITAHCSKVLPRLGHISCGYHLIDISFHGKTVYISFHHALCDGKGIKPFVETLIYYYCKLRYRSKASADGIRLAGSPLLNGETTEPNDKSYCFDESKPAVDISRDAYALPENIIEEHETDYRYEVTIAAKSFMQVCKANGATPVIMVSLLTSAGIAELFPEFDKPINANIAVDIRNALDLPNTFKNCVRSMPLPYTREFLAMPLHKQASIQRTLLNKQRNKDHCRRAANASAALFDKLDSLVGYKAKQGMMDFFNGMLLNTYIISYLGQLLVNENAKYITTVGFYNSGAAGIGITMLACGEKFHLNFKQSFASDQYVKAFCHQLERLGISYTLSKAIPFVTPKDSIIQRGNI